MLRNAALAILASASMAAASGLEITVQGETVEGVIVIDLLEDVAPKHVERITTLAASGAYDGVTFHRVIEGFMSQTGDVEYGKAGDMRGLAGTGGSNRPDLRAEFSAVPFARGTVGMARSAHPDSANSQFFIMFAPAGHLDGQYTVVGQVTSGMEVVDRLKRGHPRSGRINGPADVMSTVKVTD